MADDATTGDEVEQATDSMSADAAMTEDATGDDVMDAEVAATDEPSPLDEPAPFDEPEGVLPTGGDPLTDPMPPAPAPTGWVTPWDAPPPAVDAPASEVPEPATGDDDLAMTQQMPPLDDPMADDAVAGDAMIDEGSPMTDDAPAAPLDEPVTEFAAPYAPPPPPADAPPVDLPPPPLPVGSWEPVGGSVPPPAPATPDPGAFAPPPAADAPSGDAVAKLMISDGQQVLVDRVILIGRAPEARRFTSTEQPHLVTVPSRLHEISSTHVEVRPGTGAAQGTAVVTDMGSTNGTVLVPPGMGPEDLKPGIAVQLVPGAIINLGDGITIQVTRA
jgi:hypothetical protein